MRESSQMARSARRKIKISANCEFGKFHWGYVSKLLKFTQIHSYFVPQYSTGFQIHSPNSLLHHPTPLAIGEQPYTNVCCHRLLVSRTVLHYSGGITLGGRADFGWASPPPPPHHPKRRTQHTVLMSVCVCVSQGKAIHPCGMSSICHLQNS